MLDSKQTTDEQPIVTLVLIITLILLIGLSAFFSGSETGMMSLNRYRLRHLAKHKHRGAKRAQQLLGRPDRLLGIILIGNTFANILASAITTVLASEHFGDLGVAIATVLLTFLVLIFAEVLPKTIAAIHPEGFSFFVSFFLQYLLKILYPIVWLINGVVNTMLKPFGIHIKSSTAEALSAEELRSVVHASSSKIEHQHRHMLIGVLDLETATVEDAMVPRNDIVGIDINLSWKAILERLIHSPYSSLPVYDENIETIIGVLVIRKAIVLVSDPYADKDTLRSLLEAPYYVPETTSLQTQLIQFRQSTSHFGLVVDEYGDIQGLVTVEDIVEEIVGEFTHEEQPSPSDATKPQIDGSFLVSGSMTIRDLNRNLGFELPTHGAKTLSGLITEHLQSIPIAKTSIKVNGYPIEIMQVKGNAVKKAKIKPREVA